MCQLFPKTFFVFFQLFPCIVTQKSAVIGHTSAVYRQCINTAVKTCSDNHIYVCRLDSAIYIYTD